MTEQRSDEQAWEIPPCDHFWVSSHQPDFPGPIYWVARCQMCGVVNGAALVEELAPLVAERVSLRGVVQAVEAHMRDRHTPRDTEVYSGWHHDEDHESEDPRCSEKCFEPMTLCASCGSSFPCLEIRAFRAALAAAADAPQPAEPMTLSCVPTGCQCSCHRSGGLRSAHIVACCNPSPAQPADPPTTCEHPGETGPHRYFVDADPFDCPGPSPAVLPQPETEK